MIKVLVGGCFDVLHIGHVKFLRQAKSFGDYLIVLLESDANIKKLKGSTRPIHNQKERKEVLEALKFVDKVIILPDVVNNIFTIIWLKKLIQAKSVGAKLKIVKKYKSNSTSSIVKRYSSCTKTFI